MSGTLCMSSTKLAVVLAVFASIWVSTGQSTVAQYTNQLNSDRDRANQAQQSFRSGSAESGNGEKQVSELTLTGRFHLITGAREGVLILKAEIPKGSCIYALTQKENPQPSRIQVKPSTSFRLKGQFQPDRKPKVIERDPVFENRIEKHLELVQFFVPIEIGQGVDPKAVTAEMIFDGLICSDAGMCMPIRAKTVQAKFAGYYQAAKQRSVSPNKKR